MRRGVRGATVTLKFVQTVRLRGKVYRYFRRGDVRIKLPDLPPDDQRFINAWVQAMNATGQPVPVLTGTIAAAVQVFTRSDAARLLSPDYGRVIERELREVVAKAGKAMLRDLRAEHIRADIGALPAHKARARLKAWRLLCGHCVKVGLLALNPSNGIERPAIPKTDGHPPWTQDEIAAFRAHWPVGTVQRRAMELLYWTAARISDAVDLGPGKVGRDGVLSFEQDKTGERAFVPWTGPLPHFASEADRAHLFAALESAPPGLSWLVTERGRARTKGGLGNMVSEAARAAGVPKSAHGLRKARAIAMAEAGATPHQIGAWTGHRTLSEIAHYTAEMDRRRAVMGTPAEPSAVNMPAPAVKGSRK